jgi:Raf kinase inhibitor-like YbhB/YbcL family protein
MKELKITSPAFEHNQTIPVKYTRQGVNPPLSISGIPENTKSLTLIVDDPDAPNGTFDHWIVYNITPQQKQIAEQSVPGTTGLNSDQGHDYIGPCPPPGKPHRYFFKVYALDTMLNVDPKSTKEDIENAMKSHILAKGQLIGLYQR